MKHADRNPDRGWAMMIKMSSALLLIVALYGVAEGWATDVVVSGRIRGLEANDHVMIKLEGNSTYNSTSRWSGHWSVSKVESGVYEVRPYNQAYTFVPPTQSIRVGTQNIQGIDFQACRCKENQPHREENWRE